MVVIKLLHDYAERLFSDSGNYATDKRGCMRTNITNLQIYFNYATDKINDTSLNYYFFSLQSFYIYNPYLKKMNWFYICFNRK